MTTNNNSSNKDEISKNLWELTLQRSTRTINNEVSSIYFLGEQTNMKTKLIKSFPSCVYNKDNLHYLLDYCYLNIESTDDEDTTQKRVNMWSISQESQADYLPLLFENKNMEKNLYCITLDFSEPWNVLNELNRWLEVFLNSQKNIFSELSEEDQKRYKNNISKSIQLYTSPLSKEKDIPTETVDDKDNEDIEEKSNNDNEIIINPDIPKNNFGVNLIIIGMNLDQFTKGIGVNEYINDRFEYLNKKIRLAALDYGAAIIYTSINNQSVFDLHKYIFHLLFNKPYDILPRIIASANDEDLDTIFIPSGFDSLSYINMDDDNDKKSSVKYTIDCKSKTVLPKPKNVEKKSIEQEVKATEDSVFLKTLQFILDTQGSGEKKAAVPASNKPAIDNLNTQRRTSTTTGQAPINNQVRGFFESLLGGKGGKSASSANLKKKSPAAKKEEK